MRIERVFTVFMAVFIIIAMAYLFLKNTGDNSGITSEASAENNQNRIIAHSFDPKTTGSMGSGDVLIELTPKMVDKDLLAVNFRINTHSVSLSGFDLKEITVLEHEGHVFKPVKASRIGGHHSAGTIEFETGEAVNSFTVRIKGIPKAEERVYKWNVG